MRQASSLSTPSGRTAGDAEAPGTDCGRRGGGHERGGDRGAGERGRGRGRRRIGGSTGKSCRSRFRAFLGFVGPLARQKRSKRDRRAVSGGLLVPCVEHQGERPLQRSVREKRERRAVLRLERAARTDGRVQRTEHDGDSGRPYASRAEELIAQGRVAVAVRGDSGCCCAPRPERALDGFIDGVGETSSRRRPDALELHHHHARGAELRARLVSLVAGREERRGARVRRIARHTGHARRASPPAFSAEGSSSLTSRVSAQALLAFQPSMVQLDVGTARTSLANFRTFFSPLRAPRCVDRGGADVILRLVPSAGFAIVGITWIPNDHEPGGP